MTKTYIIDERQLNISVNKRIRSMLDKIQKEQFCQECDEESSEVIDGLGYCRECIDELFGWCNKDNRYYKLDEIDTCAYNEETYHKDYLKEASDGNYIYEDDLQEHEDLINKDNWPEYD